MHLHLHTLTQIQIYIQTYSGVQKSDTISENASVINTYCTYIHTYSTYIHACVCTRFQEQLRMFQTKVRLQLWNCLSNKTHKNHTRERKAHTYLLFGHYSSPQASPYFLISEKVKWIFWFKKPGKTFCVCFFSLLTVSVFEKRVYDKSLWRNIFALAWSWPLTQVTQCID